MKKIFLLLSIALLSICAFSQPYFPIYGSAKVYGDSISLGGKLKIYVKGDSVIIAGETKEFVLRDSTLLEIIEAHGGTGGVMDSSWNSIDIGIGNNHTSINSDGTIHQYNNGVEMFKTTINGYIGMDYINENSVLGPMALSLNSTGIRNSAVGTGSLYSNSSGNYNSGYGLQTLFNNTSGSQLIGLGARAGKYSTTLSNRLFINSLDRNNLQGDSTLSIIYGHQAFAAENQRLVVNAKLINNGAFNYGSDAGSNDAYAISIPGITVYVTGMQVTFKTNTANTGACTININSLGAKSLKIKHDQDPGDNYIESGSIVMAVYDGTYFQMIQPAAN